ncbi:spore coat protein U domain-containing protein [Isoalcanivorax beigongshangi]|uniref:Spore coat protein U domain-containing protein n=1 Tax=Isoalcanivorax beigongshangi TaxID=3238810 RepID=A0ABV4AF42_9GAMM
MAYLQNVKSVCCTQRENYRLYVDDGGHFADGWQRMRAGTSGNYMEYQILKPDSSVWNRNNAFSRVSTGLTDVQSCQVRVNPDQAARPAEIYKDTVTVIVEY